MLVLLPDMGQLPPFLKKVFCDKFVMEEWQTIRRLFGGKMVESCNKANHNKF